MFATAMLTTAQQKALEHVRAHARSRCDGARRTLDEIFRMGNVPRDRAGEVLARIRSHARVALHFHPDRPDARGQTVVDALRAGGRYRSQFETGISNGSVSAVPGGEREKWERLLFGDAYGDATGDPRERPKYGALDLVGHPDGPSPRFGSCYMLLKPAASARATFTYRDSHLDPRERGTLDELDDVLAALFADAFSVEQALGVRAVRPAGLLARIDTVLAEPLPARFARPPARNLDHYIEAQVHGDVALARDVEMLVCDPSFRGTPTGEALEALAADGGYPLAWHAGSRLDVERVPDDFRGPAMPVLARRIAPHGVLDARAIGAAVQALHRDPGAWADRGPHRDVLQELKLLWHVLVYCGS